MRGNIKKSVKNVNRFNILFAIFAFVLILSLSGCGWGNNTVQEKYDSAIDLMENGRYEEAVAIFSELDGYESSEKYISKCLVAIKDQKLDEAIQLMDSYKYDAALELLKEINGYKNADELLGECEYYIDFVFTLNETGDGYIISDYNGQATELFVPGEYAGVNVVGIGNEAFKKSDSLVKVFVPNGVNNIGSHAFSNCKSLKEISLPLSTVFVGEYAFKDCGSLEKIIYVGSQNEWNTVIKGEKWCEKNIVVFAPECSKNHHYLVIQGAVAPNCTKAGNTEGVYCSVCGEVFKIQQTIAARGHDIVKHDAKIPTCAEVGWNAYEICTRCDYTTYSELAKDETNHNIVTHNGKAPTCTETGHQAYEECLRCDYSTYVEIPKLAHDTESYGAKSPTCTQAGWDAYEKCKNCSYTTYSEIGALGHDYTVISAQAPTCVDIGWDAYEVCSRCEINTYKEIPATGKHTYNDEKTCTVCLDYADKGVIFTLVGNEYGVTGYTGNEKSVVIPYTYKGVPVTFIGERAFASNKTIEDIVFTQGIKKIDTNSFYDSTVSCVYYTGSESEWSQVVISITGNTAITEAEIKYDYDFSDAIEEISIHVIDVGQGDSILIMTPWGNILIDSGDTGSTPREALKSYLKKYNISDFEYVIFTHPDSDHIGSGDYVMQNYVVKNVIMSDCPKTTQVYNRLISAIEASGADLILIGTDSDCEKVGYTFKVGDVSFTVMGPTKNFSASNEMSVVVKLEYGETTALFTGDAESGSEAAMLGMYKNGELDCDILKVGHHGSSSSSTSAFLAAVTPKIAVISCGDGNKYGHPHTETMDKLADAGVDTYRTDKNGDVVITTNGADISVAKEK